MRGIPRPKMLLRKYRDPVPIGDIILVVLDLEDGHHLLLWNDSGWIVSEVGFSDGDPRWLVMDQA